MEESVDHLFIRSKPTCLDQPSLDRFELRPAIYSDREIDIPRPSASVETKDTAE
jgi:hypothetical protein